MKTTFTPGRIDIISMGGSRILADAKQESIDMILELGEAKERGEIGNICVMGCLSQRYLELLPQEMPEVDRWYGKFDWQDFIDTLPDRSCTESRGSDNERSGKQEGETPKSWDRTLTTPPWSAFLKISEGCDRFCAFCAIPLITGATTGIQCPRPGPLRLRARSL